MTAVAVARPGRRLPLAAAVLFAIVLGLVSSSCTAAVAPSAGAVRTWDRGGRPAVGDLSGAALLEDGATISLSDYAGKVVVVNTWGQWCGPCRSEVDDLERVWVASRDRGAMMLGINVRENGRAAPRDFVADNGVTYPSIYDPGMRSLLAFRDVPMTVTPTTVVLDREHRVAALFQREIHDAELQEVVDRLLEERP